MPPIFCPKCGSIMTLKKENDKTVAICPVCGHKEKINKKAAPVSLQPVEVEEETSVKKGIIKDKEIKKIMLDEDTVKEIINQLEGMSED